MFNMACPILSFVCFILALFIHTSDGSLRLDINPTEILPGLTESLTINCSFLFAELSDISGITTLIVSKSDQPEQFVDIVFINVFTPDDVTTLAQVDGKVSGHIDQDHASYLSVALPFPKDNDTGLYRCQMYGTGNYGRPSELFQTSLVTSQAPSIDQLMNKINQLKDQLQRQESQARNQSAEISECQSQLELQEHLAKNQSDKITECQSQLELQVNLAKNQSNALLTKILGVDFYISKEYNGHYYLLSKQDPHNATEAAQTCQDIGGYLAQITDSSENQFLKDFVHQYTGIDVVYVSGTDAEHEDRWTFTGTNTDLVFYDWGQSQPDGFDAFNCLAIVEMFEWRWADVACSYYFSTWKFLCELDTV